MRIGKVLAVLVVLSFTATSAMAAGFRLPEQGAKAMGMGMAFTAQADDPSAIYFNPAGIVQLEGQNLMVGGTYVRLNGADFTGTTPLTFNTGTGLFDIESETQEDLGFVLPNAYWTRKASPNFAYGVGIFAPFGLAQEYGNRQTSIFRNQVTNVEIQTIVVNPTVAWKVNDVLSVGAGIDFLYGKADLSQAGVVRLGAAPLDQVNIFQLDLEGDGTAWGYNLGVLLTPTENIKVGASYRSSFKLEIDDADVDLVDINGTIPFVPPGPFTAAQVFGGSTFHSSASTTINLPATLQLGVAYIRDRLTLEVDLDWTFWSTFKALAIDIRDNNGLLPDATRPENWDDVVTVDIGAEYRVTDPLALRLGFRWDPSPIPADTLSPLLPDADRLYYCAGVGYKLRNWTFDFSYLYLDKKDRSVNNQVNVAAPSIGSGFDGTWSGNAHLVAFDVGYKF
ncbi:MAG: outer membrane protein transport protein [Candidatus Deferrimicrobiaceae bacterium]